MKKRKLLSVKLFKTDPELESEKFKELKKERQEMVDKIYKMTVTDWE